MTSRMAVVGTCEGTNQIRRPQIAREDVERTFGSGLLMISPMKSLASPFLRSFATFGSAGPIDAHISYCPPCLTASDGSSRALPCPSSVGSTIALNGPFCVRLAIRRSRSFSCEVTTGLDRDVSGLENTAGTAERCERIRVDVKGFLVRSVCRTSGKPALVSRLESPELVHTSLVTDRVYEEKLRIGFSLQRRSVKTLRSPSFYVTFDSRTPISVPLRVAPLVSLLPPRYRRSSSTPSCLFVKVDFAERVHQQRRAG